MTKQVTVYLPGLLVFLLLGSPAFAPSQPVMLDRVVAVVGREPILQSDLDAQTEFYAFNNRLDPSTPGLKGRVLEAMVNEKLMLVRALEDTTISVNEDEVTNQLEALITQRIQQVGSEKRLEELYGMPVSRMRWEFRDETRKNLLVQILQQAKFGEIFSSRREVEEFYAANKDSLPLVPEELELYHIVMTPKVGRSSWNSLRDRVQTVLDSITAGSLDFTEAARRYSEDPGTAATGGDLGFVRRGEFFTEFERAVFALSEKQISGVVESPLGFHIIQLLERRGDQVHPRHILFKFKRDQSEADSTIVFLRALKDSVLRGGASFSELAKRYSDDKQSGPLGGYLGRLPATQLESRVLEVVKNLKEGDVSEPVDVQAGSTTGYQILYLPKRIPEHAMNLKDDSKRLEQLATAYKRSEEYQKWLEQLRGEIFWEIRLEQPKGQTP